MAAQVRVFLSNAASRPTIQTQRADSHMPQNSKFPPLERYVRILELMTTFPNGLSLVEVSRLLGLPKTSAHRLLRTMQDSQLIELAGGSVYLLGNRVRRLAYAGSDTEWVSAVVKPHLADMAAETGETCYLAKLDGSHRVSSILVESPDTPWRGFVLPGKGMAPHAAASAKAILAYQPAAIIDAALKEPLPQLTPHTRVDPEAIKAEYAEVRKRGYATCIGEIDEELAALGVPIPGSRLGVIYSLGITGPQQRLKHKGLEYLANVMKRYADRLSAALNTAEVKRPPLDIHPKRPLM